MCLEPVQLELAEILDQAAPALPLFEAFRVKNRFQQQNCREDADAISKSAPPYRIPGRSRLGQDESVRAAPNLQKVQIVPI
jgi:hypothetical protein